MGNRAYPDKQSENLQEMAEEILATGIEGLKNEIVETSKAVQNLRSDIQKLAPPGIQERNMETLERYTNYLKALKQVLNQAVTEIAATEDEIQNIELVSINQLIDKLEIDFLTKKISFPLLPRFSPQRMFQIYRSIIKASMFFEWLKRQKHRMDMDDCKSEVEIYTRALALVLLSCSPTSLNFEPIGQDKVTVSGFQVPDVENINPEEWSNVSLPYVPSEDKDRILAKLFQRCPDVLATARTLADKELLLMLSPEMISDAIRKPGIHAIDQRSDTDIDKATATGPKTMAEQIIEDLREHINALESEQRQNSPEQEKSTATIEDLKRQLAASKEANTRLKRENRILKDKPVDDTIRDLNKTIEDLKQQLANNRAATDELLQKYRDLLTKGIAADDLQDHVKIDTGIELLRQAGVRVNTNTLTVRELKKRLAHEKKKYEDWKAAVGNDKVSLDVLHANIREKQAELNDIQGELQAAYNRLHSARQSIEVAEARAKKAEEK